MKKRVPISQIMSTNLITITPKDSLYDAERLFKEHHIRHLPVVEGNKLVGILSYSDLLKISYADVNESDDVESIVYETFTIPQIMAKSLVTVEPDTSIKQAVELLTNQSFHSLPVVENGILQGVLTTTDLLKYFLEQY